MAKSLLERVRTTKSVRTLDKLAREGQGYNFARKSFHNRLQRAVTQRRYELGQNS